MPKTLFHPKPIISHAKSGEGSFSRLIHVDSVPDEGLDIAVCATGAERAALAVECGLEGIESFEANFRVTKQNSARFRVSGGVAARVVQTCVITLDPFATDVQAEIHVEFVRPGQGEAGTGGFAGISEDDPPDPVVDGQIDLGALAAEFLVLNLDLYPRKPGAVFEWTGTAAEETGSPFSVLQRRR
ncbi:MAG TPA: DUF177 domain-containing protein [Methylocella sp.]|nr:DUF177 domain-containing protein [Methylocella sp.]